MGTFKKIRSIKQSKLKVLFREVKNEILSEILKNNEENVSKMFSNYLRKKNREGQKVRNLAAFLQVDRVN